MQPTHIIQRRLMFAGPNRAPLSGIDLKPFSQRRPEELQPWKALSEQLMRQSYIITLLYETKPSQFGQPEQNEMDETNGSQ